MRMRALVAASQEAAEACARSQRHLPRAQRLRPRQFSVRSHNLVPPRLSARLHPVQDYLAAACSAGLLPASSALAYSACCSGTDFSVAWRALLRLSACFCKCVVLVVIVARLIFAWWQRRNMPAPAYAAALPATGHSFGGLGEMLGSTDASAAGASLTIVKADYDAFERLLGDIQSAYSAEDLSALRTTVTPEMLSYFSEQLAGNASRGLVNRVTDVKLLKGDLAEAWSEGNTDYATVAMNFALKDSLVERASGRTAEGGEPSEVTELWTFMRARGGSWLLSAIQQT